MKHISRFILTLIISLLLVPARSQTYTIATTNITFEAKSRPCLFSEIDPKAREVKKAFKKYMKKNYSVKVKGVGFITNKDFLKARDIMLGIVSNKRMNLYTHITQNPNNSNISVFGSFGYDIFIDSLNYKQEFGEMKNLMNRFLLEYLNDYYTLHINKTAKAIKKLNDRKFRLTKRMDRNDRKITRAEKRIAKLENKKIKDSKDQTAIAEKTNNLNNKSQKLGSENSKASVKIKLIENKLPALNSKLKELMIL